VRSPQGRAEPCHPPHEVGTQARNATLAASAYSEAGLEVVELLLRNFCRVQEMRGSSSVRVSSRGPV